MGWTIKEDGFGNFNVCDANRVFATSLGQSEARLIAAAPELLEACKQALILARLIPGEKHVVAGLQAAIAKAESKEPVFGYRLTTLDDGSVLQDTEPTIVGYQAKSNKA